MYFSGLMSSVLVSFLGKRFSSLFGQALSYIVGHCLIMTAWNVEMLLVGRFVCGLCQGKNKSFIGLLDLKNPPWLPIRDIEQDTALRTVGQDRQKCKETLSPLADKQQKMGEHVENIKFS